MVGTFIVQVHQHSYSRVINSLHVPTSDGISVEVHLPKSSYTISPLRDWNDARFRVGEVAAQHSNAYTRSGIGTAFLYSIRLTSVL